MLGDSLRKLAFEPQPQTQASRLSGDKHAERFRGLTAARIHRREPRMDQFRRDEEPPAPAPTLRLPVPTTNGVFMETLAY